MVFFDDVLVPWERVFLLGDVELCNGYGTGTMSNAHTGYQVLNRCVVKAEFVLGLADSDGGNAGVRVHPARAGAGGRADHLPGHAARVPARRRGRRQAQRVGHDVSGHGADPGRPRAVRPDACIRAWSRSRRLLGTSSLMALPAEADFGAGIAPEVNRYLATDSTERVGPLRGCSTWRGTRPAARSAGGRCCTSGCLAATRCATP